MENIVAVPNQPDTAVHELAPTITTPPVVKEITTAPLSIYEQELGMPYAAKYFGLNRNDFHEIKNTEMEDQIKIINDWVINKTLREEYNDSTKSFDDIITNIKEQLGIKDTESSLEQIRKIHLYLNEGKSIQQEFHVKRSSKADEIDQLRNQRVAKFRSNQPQTFRKLDGAFSNFFNK